MNTAARLLLLTLPGWSAPLTAVAQTKAPVQYRFGTDLDWDLWRAAPRLRRYRTMSARADTTPEELIGAPQNPRRASTGFALRIA